MVKVLADPERYPARSQPADGVTYAAKIDKAETRLDFTKSAIELERQVRAFTPPRVRGSNIKASGSSCSPPRWPTVGVCPARCWTTN